MLQRDYLLELISNFCDAMHKLLGQCCIHHDEPSIKQAEAEIAEILQLDRETALSLSPDSLVTMMVLSGTSDSVASYVAYSLLRLSEAYAYHGKARLSQIRHDQAVAIAKEYQWNLAEVPEGMREFDQEYRHA